MAIPAAMMIGNRREAENHRDRAALVFCKTAKRVADDHERGPYRPNH